MIESYSLHNAVLRADADAVRACLVAGCALNALDEGMSALHWAVWGGYCDIAKLLLEAGANPNVISADGVSPCWRARDFGLAEMEQLLRAFGGTIRTGEGFDETSFRIFNEEILGVPLPPND